MRILVADDHDVVRRGLIDILIEAFPSALFSEAGNGNEALEKIACFDFDLLLLDIDMPGISGLSVLQEVKRKHEELPVIMISVHSEDQYADRCLQAGAAAYISKDRASEELARAAQEILDTFDRIALAARRTILTGYIQKS